VREVVEDGVTGLLVPPDDATALTTAIRTLVDDPARRAAMGAAGRARAAAEFTVDAMARRYEAVYRDVLAGRPVVEA
jgi:glycosyltransferase involved in cell wall biosynthesis